MNTIPPTKFISRCEECLHWEKNHGISDTGAVVCETCGCCYRREEKAVFLTMRQYLRKYPKSIFAMNIRSNPTVNW